MTQQTLSTILELSRGMLRCAEEGEWEQLVSLEQQRDPLLKGLFYADIRPEDVEAVRETVLQSLEIDKKVIVITEAGKRCLADDIKLIASRRKANNAYVSSKQAC